MLCVTASHSNRHYTAFTEYCVYQIYLIHTIVMSGLFILVEIDINVVSIFCPSCMM